MTTPEIVHYADGHYRRMIYGLGPYIADYPEQVLITCIVQGWCPRCTAKAKQLDEHAGRCTAELAEHCRRVFDEKTCWDDYGIVSGAMVSATHKFIVEYS
jgi:hypothetical protein